MGFFGNLLRGALVSAAAIAASLRPQRPTPRKPERRKAVPTANPLRAKARAAARAAARAKFDRQIRKEREIGVDPIFWHGDTFRKDMARPGWLKRSKEWDQAHG